MRFDYTQEELEIIQSTQDHEELIEAIKNIDTARANNTPPDEILTDGKGLISGAIEGIEQLLRSLEERGETAGDGYIFMGEDCDIPIQLIDTNINSYYIGPGFKRGVISFNFENIVEFIKDRYLKHHFKVLDKDESGTQELNNAITQMLNDSDIPFVYQVPEGFSYRPVEWKAPRHYYQTKDIISQNLTRLEPGEWREFDRSGRNHKNIKTAALLELTQRVKGIDEFTQMVLFALFSEYLDGKRETTAENIYRIIKKDSGARLRSDKTRERILNACKVLNSSSLTIDCKAECENFSSYKELVGGYSGSLISVSQEVISTNGVISYDRILIGDIKLSPLYSYASATKGILKIPFEELNEKTYRQIAGDKVTKTYRGTEELMAIEKYLIRRIGAIPHTSNYIKIDSLMEELQIQNDKKRRQRVRGKVERKLDKYISLGLILGYNNEIGPRGKLLGWTIEKAPKDKK